MGKAFSEEEKELIHDRLREVGLKLFAERGIKKLSIKEITQEVGIAQGGFYTFYKSKEDFAMDLFKFRITDKLKRWEQNFPVTLEDPVGFVSDMLYEQGTHLKDNKAFNDKESDSWFLFLNRDTKEKVEVMKCYRSFFRKLIRFWEENGYEVICDMSGLMNAMSMAVVIFTNAEKVSTDYFGAIYRTYCDGVVQKFLSVRKK